MTGHSSGLGADPGLKVEVEIQNLFRNLTSTNIRNKLSNINIIKYKSTIETMSTLVSDNVYHNMPALIGPSLLASDLSNLVGESSKVIDAGADYLHLDVMDGHFVPNLTFGAPVISCLRKHTKAILDVHLMVTNPELWVDDMASAGADIFCFHVEINLSKEEKILLIQRIKEKGMKVGLAIKPNTPVESVYPYIHLLDQILVMTVEPGFGGQKFMNDMMPKVRTLRNLLPMMNIQVDGGLGPDTIDLAAKAGANMIVAGSSVFKAEYPTDVIQNLRKSINVYGNGQLEEI